jgi:chromosome segregation ATPase
MSDYGELVERLRDAQGHAHSTGDAHGFELCGRSADAIVALGRERDEAKACMREALATLREVEQQRDDKADACEKLAAVVNLRTEQRDKAEARADQLAAENERLTGELAAAEQHIKIVRESRDILHDERDALKAIVSAREDMDVQHAEVIDQQLERIAALEQELSAIGAVMKSGGMTDGYFLSGAVLAMREHLEQAEARAERLAGLLRECPSFLDDLIDVCEEGIVVATGEDVGIIGSLRTRIDAALAERQERER